jgi:hypothetical protein
MRFLRISLLAALASAALLVPATGASAASFHNCKGSFNSDGSKGDFYRLIKAKNTGCSTARTVTKAWIVHAFNANAFNPTSRVTIRGFSCKGKAVMQDRYDTDGGLLVTCTKGTKAVRFYGHP